MRKTGLEPFMTDNWADHDSTHALTHATYRVVIVGGKFGGLLIAARHVQAGITDFVIIEKGADFWGGGGRTLCY